MINKFQTRINKEMEILSDDFAVAPTELYEPIRYTLALGGKRIRPLFVLLACDMFGGKADDAIHAALAVELFHNFTLVHDDIMDNAPLRRNQATIHNKWNNSTAILSGDVMMVKAYQHISRSGLPPEILTNALSVFNDMAVKVCEGQQWDLNYEQAVKITIQQYFKMIELKTAVLIAACMKLGAIIGDATADNAERMYEFGKNIGIAFQLQDDLLDVYGEQGKFGKQIGGDIIANKKTFLLIKTMELVSLNPYKKDELAQWISFNPQGEESIEKINAVKQIYNFCDIKRITEKEIQSFHRKALAALEEVSIASKKKQVLSDFTSALLKRET